METIARIYEGMFLVDSAQAAADWEGTLKAIENVLSRSGAEIVSMRKWDERRLAYDVDGKSRGTYILVYFRVNTDQIPTIERAVQLNEQIMRVLILRTDRMTEDDMKKPTPAEEERREEERSAESDDDSNTDEEERPRRRRSESRERSY